MKLNHECIREVMLYLESNLDFDTEIELNQITINNFSIEEILYTAKKLNEAGYIKAKIIIDIFDGTMITVEEITWNGHKFLDTIRDNQVWAHTKKILSKVSSASISFVSDIASQVLTNLIKQQLGINNI